MMNLQRKCLREIYLDGSLEIPSSAASGAYLHWLIKVNLANSGDVFIEQSVT